MNSTILIYCLGNISHKKGIHKKNIYITYIHFIHIEYVS